MNSCKFHVNSNDFVLVVMVLHKLTQLLYTRAITNNIFIHEVNFP